MNKLSPPSLLGSLAAWENEALSVLANWEIVYERQIPRLELRSEVLRRLHRHARAGTPVNDGNHLVALVLRIVQQVLLNHGRDEQHHYQKHLYVEQFDFPVEETDLVAQLEERWDELLGSFSPLSPDEKLLLKAALEDPAAFIVKRGINQSALAEHMGVHQSTISRRWQQILEKARAWQQTPDLPMGF
ncbi:MAG TPA: hypothetical protein VGC39_01540 [Candidatus Methylacidiphilales bacterium]